MALVLTSFYVSSWAFDTALDRRALEEAISIGQSRIDSIRTRFHLPYRIPVGVAPLDFIEVITPFRKVVLSAEMRARAGDRSYGLKEAQEAAGRPELTLHVELTFHPLNTFITVPGYLVSLSAGAAAAPPIQPLSIDRIPRFGPRLEGLPFPTTPSSGALILPGGSQPLMGATLIARFSDAALDARGVYEVRVLDGANVLGKAKIDFGRLR